MDIEIPQKAFNPVYLPLLREEGPRYLVLCGGAGCGGGQPGLYLCAVPAGHWAVGAGGVF